MGEGDGVERGGVAQTGGEGGEGGDGLGGGVEIRRRVVPQTYSRL